MIDVPERDDVVAYWSTPWHEPRQRIFATVESISPDGRYACVRRAGGWAGPAVHRVAVPRLELVVSARPIPEKD